MTAWPLENSTINPQEKEAKSKRCLFIDQNLRESSEEELSHASQQLQEVNRELQHKEQQLQVNTWQTNCTVFTHLLYCPYWNSHV